MNYKRTKIVCTIGPSSSSPEILQQMIEKGMNVARLNFSHGSIEEKVALTNTIREVSDRLGRHVAILADLSGPKLRFGDIGRNELKRDQRVKLFFGKREGCFEMQFDVSSFVKPGERIFFNDGLVETEVLAVNDGEIEALVKNDGFIDSKRGINMPDTSIGDNAFTQKDRNDCIAAAKMGVEYIALSFVQSVTHVSSARDLIDEIGSRAKIIVKVEKPEAVANLSDLVEASDGIMVARGDLAIETSASKVPLIQQKIIELCRQMQKPVIVATQMLESMIENPRPTRAEVSDVANAVLSEVDAVMLSGESAAGKFPVESVSVMSQVINEIEQTQDYHRYIKINFEKLEESQKRTNAIVASAASLAYRLGNRPIIIGSVSGKTARQLSSFRPDIKIIVATHDEYIARQLSLVWGVSPIVVDTSEIGHQFVVRAYKKALSDGLLSEGEQIVAVWGAAIGESGTTDTIRVVNVLK